MIKIALGKGRISDKFIEIMASNGITFEDYNSRKLIIADKNKQFEIILIKPVDVPVYVESGHADIGIVGVDSVWESECNVYEIMDLGFSVCKLCIAGPRSAYEKYRSGKYTIATKYVNVANKHFITDLKQDVKLVKLSGSIEIAPLVGLSDVIFDVVETGRTLVENNLEVLDEIYECSAIVISNLVSLKTRKAEIDQLLLLLSVGLGLKNK